MTTIADYYFLLSPKGWSDNAVALKWVTELFDPCNATSVGPLPRLLILDGHESHLGSLQGSANREILFFSVFHHTLHILFSL